MYLDKFSPWTQALFSCFLFSVSLTQFSSTSCFMSIYFTLKVLRLKMGTKRSNDTFSWETGLATQALNHTSSKSLTPYLRICLQRSEDELENTACWLYHFLLLVHLPNLNTSQRALNGYLYILIFCSVPYSIECGENMYNLIFYMWQV